MDRSRNGVPESGGVVERSDDEGSARVDNHGRCSVGDLNSVNVGIGCEARIELARCFKFGTRRKTRRTISELEVGANTVSRVDNNRVPGDGSPHLGRIVASDEKF